MNSAGQTPAPLSPRQRRICALALQGFGDKDIARELGMTFCAVRRHWERTFQKLSCHKRIVAALIAKEQATLLTMPPSGQPRCRPVGKIANGNHANTTARRRRATLNP